MSVRICTLYTLGDSDVRLREGTGVRVTDLLDRVDAGDSMVSVARDFNVDPSSLSLLLFLRHQLRTQEKEK